VGPQSERGFPGLSSHPMWRHTVRLMSQYIKEYKIAILIIVFFNLVCLLLVRSITN
jgi:hypothetical protein